MRRVPHRSRGSITLVALCLAVVIGLSLASYLALCQQSLLLSTRTMHLDRARLLAESGLEEALWSLNSAAHPNSTVSSTAWTNATWTTSGLDKSCTFSGYNLGNGATGTIAVTIANFGGPTASLSIAAPIITATATVTVPSLGTFTKTLVATTKPAPLFPNAIGVLNGSLSLPTGTRIDSWDSDYDATAIAPTPTHDYNYSATLPVVYGMVSPVAPNLIDPLNCNATVAAPSITLNGDATIKGYATTFGNPINNPGGNALIKGPTTTAAVEIDPARVGKSAFIPFFSVTAPTTPPSPATWQDLPSNATWATLPSEIKSIGNSSNTEYWRASSHETGLSPHTLNSGGDDLFLDGNKSLEINGYVVLVIDEDFEMKDNATIQINPGGRLELYVRDDVMIIGSASFKNLTFEPKNLALFCTKETSNLYFQYSSTSSDKFIGVMYSASTSDTLIFNTAPEIQGALLSGYTPIFSTPVTLHYDTALQYLPRRWFLGVATPFLLNKVVEPPPEYRTHADAVNWVNTIAIPGNLL